MCPLLLLPCPPPPPPRRPFLCTCVVSRCFTFPTCIIWLIHCKLRALPLRPTGLCTIPPRKSISFSVSFVRPPSQFDMQGHPSSLSTVPLPSYPSVSHLAARKVHTANEATVMQMGRANGPIWHEMNSSSLAHRCTVHLTISGSHLPFSVA